MLAEKLAPSPLCQHDTWTSLGLTSALAVRSWQLLTVSSFLQIQSHNFLTILHHAFRWSSVISLLTFNGVCYMLGEVPVYFHPLFLVYMEIEVYDFTPSIQPCPVSLYELTYFHHNCYEQNFTRGDDNLVLFNFLSSLVTSQQRALNTYYSA
jgi:hypothetical protein